MVFICLFVFLGLPASLHVCHLLSIAEHAGTWLRNTKLVALFLFVRPTTWHSSLVCNTPPCYLNDTHHCAGCLYRVKGDHVVFCKPGEIFETDKNGCTEGFAALSAGVWPGSDWNGKYVENVTSRCRLFKRNISKAHSILSIYRSGERVPVFIKFIVMTFTTFRGL